jgi:hypothetical protein
VTPGSFDAPELTQGFLRIAPFNQRDHNRAGGILEDWSSELPINPGTTNERTCLFEQRMASIREWDGR